MKKIKLIPLALALLIFLCGCKRVSKDANSSVIDVTSDIVSKVTSDASSGGSEATTESSSAKQPTASKTTGNNKAPSATSGGTTAATNVSVSTGDVKQIKQVPVPHSGPAPKALDSLNAKQKEHYSKLYSMAVDMTEGFINLGATYADINNDVAVAYRALLYDFPELFWMPSTYAIGDNGKNETCVAFKFSQNGQSSDYLIQKSQKAGMEAQLNAAVNAILSKCNGDIYSNELTIHDSICSAVDYVNSGDGLQYTSYGALVKHTAVCEGYARAFQLLCNKKNIACVLVNGVALNSSGKLEGHMWNKVKLGNDWYHVDTTNDDQNLGSNGTFISHCYFNATDAVIGKSCNISAHVSKVSFGGQDANAMSYNFFSDACKATTYYYFNYQCSPYILTISSDMQQAANAIIAANQKGMKELQFAFLSDVTYESFAGNMSTYNNTLATILYQKGIQLYNMVSLGETVFYYWK